MLYSYYLILAFYIILIGLFSGIGVYVAKELIVTITDQSGFILGGFVGVCLSYYLFINYGSEMIQQ
jgi:hypothetical protein